jgi:hypothetical protein
MKFFVLTYAAQHVKGEYLGSGCGFFETEAEALKECRNMARRAFPYQDGWRNYSFVVNEHTSFIFSQQASRIILDEVLKGEDE